MDLNILCFYSKTGEEKMTDMIDTVLFSLPEPAFILQSSEPGDADLWRL